MNACDLGRVNYLSFYLPNILLCYHILFNKMSNEGQEQNKTFVFINSVAEHRNVCRSSVYQADLSILSNASHSDQEGMQQHHGFAQCCAQRDAVVSWEQNGMAQVSDPGVGQKLCFGSNTCWSLIIHVFM